MPWRRLAIFASVTIPTAAFGYLSVRNVPLSGLWNALGRNNLVWLAPSLVLLAGAIFLRALRWQLLFEPGKRPPLWPVTSALILSYLFNNLLPARAGEAARVIALHRSAGTPRAESLATVITERACDVLSLLIILFVALPLFPTIHWIRTAGVVAGVTAGGAALAAVVLMRHGERAVSLVLRPLAKLGLVSDHRVDFAVKHVTCGLVALRRPRLAVAALLLTTASWLVMAGSFWLLSRGFSFHVPLMAGILLVVTINLSMVIPSSPGAIGVFEAASLLALAPYHVHGAHALAFALVLHALNWVPFIAVGGAILAWGRRSRPRARPTFASAANANASG